MLTIAGGIVLGGIALFVIFAFFGNILAFGIQAVIGIAVLAIGFALLMAYIFLMDAALGQYKAYGILFGMLVCYFVYYFFREQREKREANTKAFESYGIPKLLDKLIELPKSIKEQDGNWNGKYEKLKINLPNFSITLQTSDEPNWTLHRKNIELVVINNATNRITCSVNRDDKKGFKPSSKVNEDELKLLSAELTDYKL